jgi:DNA primase
MTTDSVVAFYRRVSPLLVRRLGGMPLVTARYMDGPSPVFSASLHGPAPGNEATVPVHAASGDVQYLALSESSILYKAHRGALELHSWTPDRACGA